MNQPQDSKGGLIAAASAFLIWGTSPLYWKPLASVQPLEIICHRIVWGAPCVALVLLLTGRLGRVRDVFASRRAMAMMLLSSVLVSVNWVTYVLAVNSARVVEASMGYYINPLVNVFLGFVFLRDRLRRLQWLAIALAAVGVLNMVVDYGRLPWVALVLAFTFGSYGLVRKVVRVDALPGLLFELCLLGVFAVSYILWREHLGLGGLGAGDATVVTLLLCSGVFTVLPLFLFTIGARNLRLATLGLTQYIAPTGMFTLGVFVYGEPFTRTHLVTYLLIWAGVIVYAWEGLSQARKARRVTDHLGHV